MIVTDSDVSRLRRVNSMIVLISETAEDGKTVVLAWDSWNNQYVITKDGELVDTANHNQNAATKFNNHLVDTSKVIGEVWLTEPTLDGEHKTAIKVGTSLLDQWRSHPFVWVIIETGEILAPDDLSVVRQMTRTPRP